MSQFSVRSDDIATFTKLLRVALLLPFVLVLTRTFRSQTAGQSGGRPPVLPWFLAAFTVLVVLNSLGLFSAAVIGAVSIVSGWCLVVAIAALGMKTSFKALADIGPKAVGLVVTETLFIAGIGPAMIFRLRLILGV